MKPRNQNNTAFKLKLLGAIAGNLSIILHPVLAQAGSSIDIKNNSFSKTEQNLVTPEEEVKSFNGEGLSFTGNAPEGDYTLTLEQRSAKFELPSLLNIGGSYDFISGKNRITGMANFTSNSFSRDFIGAGIEYAFNEMFMLRGGYRHELGGLLTTADASVYTGLSGGVSLEVPTNKKNENKFGIDIAIVGKVYWQHIKVHVGGKAAVRDWRACARNCQRRNQQPMKGNQPMKKAIRSGCESLPSYKLAGFETFAEWSKAGCP